MKIVTFNTYEWIDARLREKHDVTRIQKEEKIPFWSRREKPDRYIIFGWWDKARENMLELKNQGIKSAIPIQERFLIRATATNILDNYTRFRSSYERKIVQGGDVHSVEEFKMIAEDLNQTIVKSGKKWVIKEGNEHQGEDKYLTSDKYNFVYGTSYVVEPYVEGRSVRVLIIGKDVFKIEHINSNNWIRNINPEEEITDAHIPREVIADAQQIAKELKLGLVGIDYQIGRSQYLPLEINIMPGCPDNRTIQAAYSQWFLDNCS